MHIAPGTEGIQPTNINWTLVLMTLVILVAIGTLIYLMVTIIEAVKGINKALDQALATKQLQAQQVQQTQGHMQNMPAQPAAQPAAQPTTQPSVMNTQAAQAMNQYPAPSDKALNEAWKAGYESAKAQYESLQSMPAMPTNGDITNKSANTTDDAANAEIVEPIETIVEDATPVEDTSSATDEARESIDK